MSFLYTSGVLANYIKGEIERLWKLSNNEPSQRERGVEDLTVKLIWSGGLDSTILLETVLALGMRVDIVSANIINNTEKTEREKKSRETILGKLVKKYPKKIRHYYEQDIVMRQQVVGCALRRTQYPVHLFNSIYYPEDLDVILLGFIQDDVMHVPDENGNLTSDASLFQKTFNTFKPMLGSENNVSMMFPLINLTKEDIYKEATVEALTDTTWCEHAVELYGKLAAGPYGKKMANVCFRCKPCLLMMKTIAAVEVMDAVFSIKGVEDVKETVELL